MPFHFEQMETTFFVYLVIVGAKFKVLFGNYMVLGNEEASPVLRILGFWVVRLFGPPLLRYFNEVLNHLLTHLAQAP